MAVLVKDPVCGMDVDAQAAAAQHEYNGVTFYFCCTACRNTFAADPGRYTRR